MVFPSSGKWRSAIYHANVQRLGRLARNLRSRSIGWILCRRKLLYLKALYYLSAHAERISNLLETPIGGLAGQVTLQTFDECGADHSTGPQLTTLAPGLVRFPIFYLLTSRSTTSTVSTVSMVSTVSLKWIYPAILSQTYRFHITPYIY